MIDAEQVTKLRERLQEKRYCIFDVQQVNKYDGENDKTRVDAYIISLNFQPLGERWITFDRRRTSEIITELMHRDQAYSTIVMPIDKAQTLSAEILDLFSKQARYYTNWGDGWMPLTGATFDMGVVIIDDQNISIFCIEDED